jgi:hypothetical protein
LTTKEKLFFCGGVLGPVLIAQAMAELLRQVHASSPPLGADTSEDGSVDRLLRQAFPAGLEI